jgi:lipoyl-dependent peroxiredoxin subunit D
MSMSEKVDVFLEKSFGPRETAVFRDLSLNFKKLMEDSSLDVNERLMNTAAIARSLHWKELESFATGELKELGVGEAEIAECFEAAAIMGMLNTYYKFKGFLSAEVLADTAYQRAGLRMNSLSKPLNGKQNFEMMALAVSVVNGCPTCVSSHEKALTDLGVTRDKIHDLARLASVTKGLSGLN